MPAPNPQPQAALVEIGVMFLPAFPAYLWVWPNLSGSGLWIFQIIAYLYVLAGTVWIIKRHWSFTQVGVTLHGLALSLACAVFVLAGRQLIIKSVDWLIEPDPMTPLQIAGNVLFYFALVGLTEEILFRGLLYTTLEQWRGIRWAVLGSSLGFLLWHILGHGVLIGVTMFFIGLAFALFRLRLGSIIGLIIMHALWDLQSALQVSSSNAEIVQQLGTITDHPGMLRLGTFIMVLPFLYLWLIHPRLARWVKSKRYRAGRDEQLPSI